MNDHIIDHLPNSSKFLDERTTTRIVFLRKLYALLALQWVIVFLSIRIVGYHEDAATWISKNTVLNIVLSVLLVVLAVVVYFRRRNFRKVPLNVLAYVLFTGLLAYTLISWADTGKIVLLFSVSVLVLCIALLFYALTTRLDLTFLGGTIYILGAALFSYLGFLIATDVVFFNLILLSLLIVVLGFYLIYDTRFIIVGQSLNSPMEDAFVGSIVIYLDMLFIGFRLIESLGKVFKRNRF